MQSPDQLIGAVERLPDKNFAAELFLRMDRVTFNQIYDVLAENKTPLRTLCVIKGHHVDAKESRSRIINALRQLHA